MARVLYFDCFSGISGDMVLGALIDAGLPLDEVRRALGPLEVELTAAKVLRAGVSATKFTVSDKPSSPSPSSPKPSALISPGHNHDHGHYHHDHSHGHGHSHSDSATPSDPQPLALSGGHHHPHRSLLEIFAIIDRLALSAAGRARAKSLFRELAETEAAIHQMPVEQVHLHEVGALDSIVDILGAVFALEWAGADEIVCSPLNVGGGMVDSAHGHFPVPAPATLALLTKRQAPVYSGPVKQELVTPTGALIATSYAASFGPLPSMTVERVGYGAGDRNPRETPNVLRVVIGRKADAMEAERVTVIECEIDDMNPQIYGVVMDRLYAAGALEVFYIPVQMKKNRPGTLLTVIAPSHARPALTGILFRETTTIGVRYSEVDRECLQREFVSVETPIGRVRFKLAWRDGVVVNAVPEFDDCVKIALAEDLPVKEVQAIAVQAYGRHTTILPDQSPAGRSRDTEPRHS